MSEKIETGTKNSDWLARSRLHFDTDHVCVSTPMRLADWPVARSIRSNSNSDTGYHGFPGYYYCRVPTLLISPYHQMKHLLLLYFSLFFFEG